MGTKANPGTYDCYNDLASDEPYFTLAARDFNAPNAVEMWAHSRSNQIDKGEKPESDRAKVKEAYAVAKAMREWWVAKNKPPVVQKTEAPTA